jgi:hypothetical protein
MSSILKIKDPTSGQWFDIPSLIGPQGLKGDKGDRGPQGDPGKSGEDGKDGTSIEILSIKESDENGGDNIVTFSDGHTLTIKNGAKGSTGDPGPKGDNGEPGP